VFSPERNGQPEGINPISKEIVRRRSPKECEQTISLRVGKTAAGLLPSDLVYFNQTPLSARFFDKRDRLKSARLKRLSSQDLSRPSVRKVGCSSGKRKPANVVRSSTPSLKVAAAARSILMPISKMASPDQLSDQGHHSRCDGHCKQAGTSENRFVIVVAECYETSDNCRSFVKWCHGCRLQITGQVFNSGSNNDSDQGRHFDDLCADHCKQPESSASPPLFSLQNRRSNLDGKRYTSLYSSTAELW
jgi:hypothetical protein